MTFQQLLNELTALVGKVPPNAEVVVSNSNEQGLHCPVNIIQFLPETHELIIDSTMNTFEL